MLLHPERLLFDWVRLQLQVQCKCRCISLLPWMESCPFFCWPLGRRVDAANGTSHDPHCVTPAHISLVLLHQIHCPALCFCADISNRSDSVARLVPRHVLHSLNKDGPKVPAMWLPLEQKWDKLKNFMNNVYDNASEFDDDFQFKTSILIHLFIFKMVELHSECRQLEFCWVQAPNWFMFDKSVVVHFLVFVRSLLCAQSNPNRNPNPLWPHGWL